MGSTEAEPPTQRAGNERRHGDGTEEDTSGAAVANLIFFLVPRFAWGALLKCEQQDRVLFGLILIRKATVDVSGKIRRERPQEDGEAGGRGGHG